MPATRYQTLVKSDVALCSEGCPIIIEASAIVNDTSKDQILAQLKLKNISDRKIIACKVSVEAFEVNGSVLNGVDGVSYLDLSAKQGDTFGTKTPIYLPDKITRIIKPSVTEIVYEDHEIWTPSGNEWKPIPEQDKVQFADPELQKQFKMEAGGTSVFKPVLFDGFFRCSCGTINKEGTKCYKCQNTYEKVASILADEQGLVDRKEERVSYTKYKDALSKGSKVNDKASLALAMKMFEKLGSYKDSEERAIKCQERIQYLEEKEEQERIRKEKEKEQEEAKKKEEEQERIATQKKKAKKRKIIFASVFVSLCLILGIVAYLFWPNLKLRQFQSTLKTASAGTIVTFGKYEQKDIEWIVLQKIGNRALLITKDAIAFQPFNQTKESTSWGNCSLRYWVNDVFAREAFTNLEFTIIPETTRTDKNSEYSQTATERLFLLSEKEANLYFKSYDSRVCTYNGDPCIWWLRAKNNSPVNMKAPYVKETGKVERSGMDVSYTQVGVRPALWIDLGE